MVLVDDPLATMPTAEAAEAASVLEEVLGERGALGGALRVVAAARPEQLRGASAVLVLRRGEVVASGTYEKLEAPAGGYWAHLVAAAASATAAAAEAAPPPLPPPPPPSPPPEATFSPRCRRPRPLRPSSTLPPTTLPPMPRRRRPSPCGAAAELLAGLRAAWIALVGGPAHAPVAALVAAEAAQLGAGWYVLRRGLRRPGELPALLIAAGAASAAAAACRARALARSARRPA